MTVLKANSLAYKQQSFEINQPTANSTYSFTQNTSTLLEDLIFDVRLRLRVAADGYNTGDILWTYFENGVHESPGGLGRGIAIHGNPTSDQTFSVSMPDSGALTAIHANGGTCETLLSNLDILIQIRSHLDWTPAVV